MISEATQPLGINWYRTIWRWHFYAGVLCIPFVLWLGAKGAVYLFKPQIETFLDRPYSNLAVSGAPLSPAVLAEAATRAVPGSVLRSYQLPPQPNDARQIIVSVVPAQTRVYVHPASGEVLSAQKEEGRPMEVVFRLHGELLAGRFGSTLVEIAASWTIVLLLTGMFLWWPRSGSKAAGTLYPRLSAGGRTFWRDMHAVTALWVSTFALFLILSGLPWAKNWGAYLASIREVTGTTAGQQDWSAGSEADRVLREVTDAQVRATMDAHAEHGGMTTHQGAVLTRLDLVVPAAQDLRLAPPVEIAPPTSNSSGWRVTSNAPDRTLRETYWLDNSGKVLQREAFGDRHWIDQVVGIGIAIHEGAMFGVLNQIVSLLTVLGLMIAAGSAAVMWWRRRPEGVLGAPRASGPRAYGPGVFVCVAMLAVVLPLFGATALAVLLIERIVLKRWAAAARWLGLRTMPQEATQ
jgi:uncharacterized iron-regulated membrane protein